jgi:electron transfer flavoprotein beta subunit
MLVFALVKGVPANTARVVTIGGILRREEMDIVLNPYDRKTVEAADYFRRRVGGKLAAVSMGPHAKIIPIMRELFEAEVRGIDEAYILSDRRLAGSDTWATSYALSRGIRKILDLHRDAVSRVRRMIEEGAEDLEKVAMELYQGNLLPNIVYNDKPAIRDDSIVAKFLRGEISREDALRELGMIEERIYRDFVVFAGIKSSDGETGNVGPQVAEALSEALGFTIPHTTYVVDFDYLPTRDAILVRRRLWRYIQVLEVSIPAVLTVHTDYRAPPPPVVGRRDARLWMFRGKRIEPVIWSADDIGAEPGKVGLAGSPTVVGPGVDIGRPLVRKIVGKSLVFTRDVEKIEAGGKAYGPFRRGDLADNLPQEVIESLRTSGTVKVFDYDDLAEELIKALKS